MDILAVQVQSIEVVGEKEDELTGVGVGYVVNVNN